jgi:chromate transporter
MAKRAVRRPSLARLTWLFLRVGNTTFGGGYASIAAFQRELVEREKWITHDDFALAFSLGRLTPGTNIVAFCAATGWRILGIPGAVGAVLGETLPSAVLAVLITQGYESGSSNPLAMAALGAMSAAVVGIMWAAAWLLTRPYLGGSALDPARTVRAVLVTGGAFLAAWKFGITPIPILAVAALAGSLWKSGEVKEERET